MFAKTAKKEGFEQIAAIFLETAEQEFEHAKTFFKYFSVFDRAVQELGVVYHNKKEK